MASDLYKIGRLVNNSRFVTVVEAGMLKYAQSITLGGTLTNEKNFAIWVLKNPMAAENSMIALVASDQAVLDATVIEGEYANAENVPDSAVSAVIAAKWSLVATKFPASTPQ
ncbi:Hypothetical Protein OBI_RACECAR_96 [Arthrobacter phage Racecar]|nr:hypothetical protein PBI_RACECAR_178 [Arthrobacter phage Racecar]QFG12851.1 hypothetical protein PBI_MIMI_175 [Arthrobacter phage Mimi]